MKYTAAVIGLGRMGSTFDDEIDQARGPGGDNRGPGLILPYCHGPSYYSSEQIRLGHCVYFSMHLLLRVGVPPFLVVQSAQF